MVYDPATLRRLGLTDALLLALFPRSVRVLTYTFYRPGERGAIGGSVNATLRALIGLNGLLNAALLPFLMASSMIAGIVSLPLLLPYWTFRWLFGRDDDPLRILVEARIAAFPGQTLIWIVSSPVKVVQVITVLVAISMGPKTP